MLDLNQAVDEFERSILLNKQIPYKSSLLQPIADYSSPISLSKLRQISVPSPLRRLKLIPGALLDEKELNWVFAAGDWRNSQESPQALIAAMPSGTVSSNIKRVGVWKRLERALERKPSTVAAYGDRAFFVIEGTSAEPYLVTIDLKKRLIASSCPEYNSTDPNSRRRLEICKHIVAALTYYRHEIFDLSKLPRNVIEEWEASYQKSKYSDDILANYHYYFIKKFVPLLGFRASYYAECDAVKEAVRCVTGGGFSAIISGTDR
jgi:hypothetical protein